MYGGAGCGGEELGGVVTTQLPDSGAIGATYKDTAHLTGGAAPTGTITFRLYSNNDCTGLLHSETATVAGNGDYTTATGFVLNHAGTYYWTASYGGDSDNNPAAETSCTAEPVVVAKNSPEVSTTQNPASGNVGDTYNDTAHLTGGAAPTGTITFKLYSNDDCTGLLDTETATVSGNGDYSTPTVSRSTARRTTTGSRVTAAIRTTTALRVGVPTSRWRSMRPSIHIVKTADAAQVNAGEQIGFTLTVYNTGTGDAKGVNLSDPLPTNAGSEVVDRGPGRRLGRHVRDHGWDAELRPEDGSGRHDAGCEHVHGAHHVDDDGCDGRGLPGR